MTLAEQGWARMREMDVNATRNRPKVAVIKVIEVRFVRGAGVEGDPMREVIALFRDNGEPIVEIDPSMGDS